MTNKFLVHVLQFIFSVTSVLYDKKRWIYEKKDFDGIQQISEAITFRGCRLKLCKIILPGYLGKVIIKDKTYHTFGQLSIT